PPRSLYLRCNVVAALVALAALVAVEAAPSSVSLATTRSDFADALWDDGQAEVARYDATRVQYGKPRDYELVQVVVKEPFDPATRTKPDAPRAGVLDALKLVRVEAIPTGRLYEHRRTVNLRVSRAEPWRLLSAEGGAQDWCGESFALFVPRAGGFVKHVHSYFDGQGDEE